MSSDHRLDPSTRARIAAKDMLRGLRYELERLKEARPMTGLLPPQPSDALQGFFQTVDKIAATGEHLARDLLFTRRDRSRYDDFFDPRAALVADPDAGHRFVRSRYAALKLVLAGLTHDSGLITENKIATALSSLATNSDETPASFEAGFTIALAREMPISLAHAHDHERVEVNQKAALIIGLAGTVAARDSERDARDLPELITICEEVIKLRQSRLLPVFNGPAPDIVLATIFDELADALKDF